MADTKKSLQAKRLAYLRTFTGDNDKLHINGDAVLADLKKYCGMTKPGIVTSPQAGVVDPYATIYRAGMRDVYLRIVGFLSIDETHLFQENAHVEKVSTAEQ